MSESLLRRLQEACDAGNFYDAQFTCKTTLTRFYSQKQYGKALDLQAKAIALLLQAPQGRRYATELASGSQDLCTKPAITVATIQEAVERLTSEFVSAQAYPEAVTYLTDFLSYLVGKNKDYFTLSGDALDFLQVTLYQQLGVVYWKVGNFSDAFRAYLHCPLSSSTTTTTTTSVPSSSCSAASPSASTAVDSPLGHSSSGGGDQAVPKRQPSHQLLSLLWEWYQEKLLPFDREDRLELALFLTRPILLILSSANHHSRSGCGSSSSSSDINVPESKLADAKALFTAMTDFLPTLDRTSLDLFTLAEDHPLTRLVKLLLLAVEKRSVALSQRLRCVYLPWLTVDPTFLQMFDQISWAYLRIPIPQPTATTTTATTQS